MFAVRPCYRLCHFIALLVVQQSVIADDPLHVRVDTMLAEIHPGPEVSLCSDAEFARRVALDLTGAIPTANEVRSFLADKSPDKRSRLVASYLDSPAYAEQMARRFDVMLMERRPDKHVKADPWKTYLLASFRENKPFNVLAQEILSADGADEKLRAPAKFILEREVEPNLVTREVGRVFFGMDLQCAQCHDHPIINDYYQSDYYGLFAFVNRTYLFQPDKKKPAVLAEKAEGKAEYKSVFTGDGGTTRPRLPGGVEITEPELTGDQAYLVKPNPKDKKVRPIPKYSRREQLALLATDGSNLAFNRNIVNRLWAIVMGRGLVHPLDHHHSDNPPVHPELLDMLATEFVQMKFDVKQMLGELMQTKTYQRSVDLPSDLAGHLDIANDQMQGWQKKLADTEQSIKTTQAATRDLEKNLEGQQQLHTKALADEQSAVKSLATAKQTLEAATKAFLESQKMVQSKQAIVDLLNSAVDKTAAAAKALPKDESVNGALKALSSRKSELLIELTTLTKKTGELDVAKQQAEKSHVAAGQMRMKLQKTIDDLAAAIASTDGELTVARQALTDDYTFASHVKNQLSRLQSFVDYASAQKEKERSQTLLASVMPKIKSAQQSLEEMTSRAKSHAEQMASLQEQHQQAAAELSMQEQQFTSYRDAAGLVNDSLAKAEAAVSKLADDKELELIAQSLTTRHQQLQADASKLQQLVDQQSKSVDQLTGKISAVMRRTIADEDTKIAAAKSQLELLLDQSGQAKADLASWNEREDSLRNALGKAWTQQFSTAVLQALTPEQLALSILQASGQAQLERARIEAALNKKSPLDPKSADPEKLAKHQVEIDKQTAAKLKAHVLKFVKLFAAAAGQPQGDFFATVDQALFFGNGGEVRSWLAPTGGNLTDRLLKLDDTQALAEELYLGTLTRLPSTEEIAAVGDYLSDKEKPKRDAVQEMAWALITSTEFRFHH